jgi:branched-chain amino acid transport system substrate-binding protein
MKGLIGWALGALLLSAGAHAQEPIKVGFPMGISGVAASYGIPYLRGAEIAAADINAAGGVLGRKIEVIPRDTRTNADEAVRQARELILQDKVDVLIGASSSAEAAALSTIAKENEVVFATPSAKGDSLTAPQNLHPYVFRFYANTTIEGQSAALLMAKWPNVKRVATMLPDYGYGRELGTAFVAAIKKVRPDIQIVDQQWPRFGEQDFTPFIRAQMAAKPDAVLGAIFGADVIAFVKQAMPLGYFQAVDNRAIFAADSGGVETTQAIGPDFPFGIIMETCDPVIWNGTEPEAHKIFTENVKRAMNVQYGSGLAILGYNAMIGVADAIRKAGSTDPDAISKALAGLQFDTPTGKLTMDAATHETHATGFWGQMVKVPDYPFAVMSNPARVDLAAMPR